MHENKPDVQRELAQLQLTHGVLVLVGGHLGG